MNVKSVLAALAVGMLLAPPAHASSVLQTSLDEAVAGSEVIFEGRVLAKFNDDSGKEPRTCLVFSVDDVIKGELENEYARLCFAGGTSGEYQMTVSDLVMPRLGEHGIYFVESLSQRLVHPLYGWSQGHYLIQSDGVTPDTVKTASGLSIFGVDAKEPAKGVISGKGVAAGIQLSRSALTAPGGKAPAMTAEAFKASLRAMAAEAGQ